MAGLGCIIGEERRGHIGRLVPIFQRVFEKAEDLSVRTVVKRRVPYLLAQCLDSVSANSYSSFLPISPSILLLPSSCSRIGCWGVDDSAAIEGCGLPSAPVLNVDSSRGAFAHVIGRSIWKNTVAERH